MTYKTLDVKSLNWRDLSIMLEKELDLYFQNSQRLYSRGKFRKTLEELTFCTSKINKVWCHLEKLPPSEAILVIKNYSEVNYLKILCLNKLGNECCALKNVRCLYNQLRSLFLNPKINGQIRDSVRNELLKITQLYQKLEGTCGSDNLLNDFNRIFYTKILL